MDLCNGGMIWSCCVDRDKVDFVDPNLGAVKDARCGEVHTSQARDEYVIDTKETKNYIVSLILRYFFQNSPIRTINKEKKIGKDI